MYAEVQHRIMESIVFYADYVEDIEDILRE